MVRRIQEGPVRHIAEGLELFGNVGAVVLEHGIKQPADVFQHHGFRSDFIHEADCFWKKVAVIFFTELFARDRKWRAGNTTGKQVDSLIGAAGKFADVFLEHLP